MFWFGRQVTLCLEEVERGKACLASRCLCSQKIIDVKLAHIGAHYWLVFFFSQIIEIYSKKFNPPCKSTRPEIYPEFKMHLSTLTRGLNAQKYGNPNLLKKTLCLKILAQAVPSFEPKKNIQDE